MIYEIPAQYTHYTRYKLSGRIRIYGSGAAFFEKNVRYYSGRPEISILKKSVTTAKS